MATTKCTMLTLWLDICISFIALLCCLTFTVHCTSQVSLDNRLTHDGNIDNLAFVEHNLHNLNVHLC